MQQYLIRLPKEALCEQFLLELPFSKVPFYNPHSKIRERGSRTLLVRLLYDLGQG